MPYINPRLREAFREQCWPLTAGEFHYCIALLVDNYLKSSLDYQRINDVMGVLACAQQEVYRRIAAPYEDIKIAENGDVFTCVPDVMLALNDKKEEKPNGQS